MRKFVGLVATLGLALAIWEPLAACGDKALLIGRGAQFRRAYAAIYPASILIYAPGRTGASAAIVEPRLHSTLLLAGHQLAVAKDPGSLAEALKSGRYDLVLGDVREYADLSRVAGQFATKPTVLSVMFEPTKQEAEAFRKQYNCRLKAGAKANEYLQLIDDEMKVRVKAGMTRALSKKS